MLEDKIKKLNIDSELRTDILNKFKEYKEEKNSSIKDWNLIYRELKKNYVYKKDFTQKLQHILSIINLAIKYTNKNSEFDEEELQLLSQNYSSSNIYESVKRNGLEPINKTAAKLLVSKY